MNFRNKAYNKSIHILLLVRKYYKEIKVLILQKKIYCTSLEGNSDYGITINSDLSVSCNCSDIYGFGKLGTLEKETISEILLNKKSAQFRKKLSEGKLPILDCVTCQNLQQSKKNHKNNKIKTPKSILLENTVNCNLNCLACKRKEITKNRTKKYLSIKDVQNISKELKNMNIKKIYYFNQGEPFLSNNIKKEIQIIKKINPEVELITSTNGMFINTKEKQEAALLFDHIYFSLDGSTQQSVSKYQKGGNFELTYNNMKELVRLRGKNKKPIIEWKYVLFRWNDNKKLLEKAEQLANKAKIDVLSFWKTPYPTYAISWNYYLGFKYFNKFGIKSWKGREIDFRKK